jgi:hypothetical protein
MLHILLVYVSCNLHSLLHHVHIHTRSHCNEKWIFEAKEFSFKKNYEHPLAAAAAAIYTRTHYLRVLICCVAACLFVRLIMLMENDVYGKRSNK